MRHAYKSLLAMLDRLPPNICRLVARDHRRPLTNHQLAERSGLSIKKIVHISRQKSWTNVPVGQVDQFRTACGVTMQNLAAQLYYLRRTFDETATIKPLAHLDKLPSKKQRRLLRLL